LAFVDPQWACSTRWILDNNVDEASLDLVFALSTTEFGEEKQHELVWEGASKPVTEARYCEAALIHTDLRFPG
jgi:hypothetical protein